MYNILPIGTASVFVMPCFHPHLFSECTFKDDKIRIDVCLVLPIDLESHV
jgi:hypothetical protein